MMGLPAGTRIWIAAGVSDMRAGFNGLAAKVQAAPDEDPFSGHVFVFRGRRGNVIKSGTRHDRKIYLSMTVFVLAPTSRFFRKNSLAAGRRVR